MQIKVVQRIKNKLHNPPPLKQLHKPFQKPLSNRPLRKYLSWRVLLNLRHRERPERHAKKNGSLASFVANHVLDIDNICDVGSNGIFVFLSRDYKFGVTFSVSILCVALQTSSYCFLNPYILAFNNSCHKHCMYR